MTDRDDERTEPQADVPDAPETSAETPAEAPDTAAEAAGHDETTTAADDLRPAQREARAPRLGRRAAHSSAGIAAVLLAALLGFVIMARSDGLPFEFDEEWAEDLLEIRGPVGDVFAFFMNDARRRCRRASSSCRSAIASCCSPAVDRGLRCTSSLASAASAVVVQLLKQLFGRARPEDILVHSDFGSFPSGHVANAATIAVALGVIFPIVWVWIAGAVVHGAHGDQPHVPRRALALRHGRRAPRRGRRRARPLGGRSPRSSSGSASRGSRGSRSATRPGRRRTSRRRRALAISSPDRRVRSSERRVQRCRVRAGRRRRLRHGVDAA